MGRLFIDPGLLRERAVLERPVETTDGAGGASTAWEAVAAVFVHVDPVSVAAIERFDRRDATATHRVLLRRRADLDRGQRFRIGTRSLAILSVHDPDESGRYLLCRCEEAR